VSCASTLGARPVVPSTMQSTTSATGRGPPAALRISTSLESVGAVSYATPSLLRPNAVAQLQAVNAIWGNPQPVAIANARTATMLPALVGCSAPLGGLLTIARAFRKETLCKVVTLFEPRQFLSVSPRAPLQRGEVVH